MAKKKDTQPAEPAFVNPFASVGLKWSKYIAQYPTPKQLALLLLPHKEAFFGGAASPGKSSALLMGALQYVDVPGFQALILRNKLTDLSQPGALLSRSHEWLDKWLKRGATYKGSEHTWYFDTFDANGNSANPAKLQFGYIGEATARDRYLSTEYQYIAFDEASQIPKSDYLYLFSRLRKCVCPVHKIFMDGPRKGEPNYVAGCYICEQQASIPLKFRAASNPGGISHAFLKKRFAIGPDRDPIEAKKRGEKVKYIGHNPKKRPYIPARVGDNPHVSQKEYEDSLSELDPITKEQLLLGDWGVSPDSRFKKHWQRFYSYRSSYVAMGSDGNGPVHTRESWLKIFMTVDSAASYKEGFQGAITFSDEEDASDTSAWAIGVWAVTSDYNLLWLDLKHFKQEIPEGVQILKDTYQFWKCRYAVIETNGLGIAVAQQASRFGIAVKEANKQVDKVVNSTEAILRMSRGKIWFPQYAPWLEAAEDEIFTWMGDPNQSDDIVDVLSDAAREVDWDAWEAGAEGSTVVEETSEGVPYTLPCTEPLFTGFDPFGF